MTPIRTVTVRSLEGLAPHVQAWDALAWNAPQALPSLLPGWADAFLRHRLLANEKWLCSFAYAGSALVGVLVVIVSPHRFLGHARPWLHTPFDDLTNSGDVLLDPQHAVPAFSALLQEVDRNVPGYPGINLHAVRQQSPLWESLKLTPSKHDVVAGNTYRYSKIDLSTGLDTYFAGLGNLRRNIRRYRKKLEEKGSVTFEMQVGSAADENFLAEFLRLEASGWKGRKGTAILSCRRRRPSTHPLFVISRR